MIWALALLLGLTIITFWKTLMKVVMIVAVVVTRMEVAVMMMMNFLTLRM